MKPRLAFAFALCPCACGAPSSGSTSEVGTTAGSSSGNEMSSGTGTTRPDEAESSSSGTTSSGAASSTGEGSSGSSGGQVAPGITHRFLAVDNGKNQLLLVDQVGGQGWSVPIPGGSRDLQRVGESHVLVSHGDGAAEYSLSDGSKGWSVSGYSEIQTARRLPGGETLLGGGMNVARFYTLDKTGTELGMIELPGYPELRLVRVLESGNLLFTAAFPFRVVEVDMNGVMVWEAPLPDKGYTAERLPGGETIATAGEPCLVVTLAPNGEITRKLGGEDNFPDIGLDWFSGFDLRPSGNVVVANWLGHDKWGTGPHLVELTPDNELVWSWEDHDAAMQVTNVLVLE